MSWTMNTMKIKMKSTKAAEAAFEAVTNYLKKNASDYETLNADQLMADLSVKGKAVVFEDSYAMHGCDFMTLIPEICKEIAASSSINAFSGEAFYGSGYGDEGNFEIRYENGTLHLKGVVYPNGYCEYLCCEECGADAVLFDEYEEGKIYICPECGEEIDLADIYKEHKPVVEEITINIK